MYLLKKYIKWGFWGVAVCPSYMLGRTVPKGKTNPAKQLIQIGLLHHKLYCRMQFIFHVMPNVSPAIH
jgi:hypothetical protein